MTDNPHLKYLRLYARRKLWAIHHPQRSPSEVSAIISGKLKRGFRKPKLKLKKLHRMWDLTRVLVSTTASPQKNFPKICKKVLLMNDRKRWKTYTFHYGYLFWKEF